MKQEEFNQLLHYLFNKIEAVMGGKSAEYSSGTDKLHNFKRAAAMDGITPIEALRGMDLKHRTSLQDMLDGIDEGKTYPQSLWEEKFIDHIDYCILNLALLAEENEWEIK